MPIATTIAKALGLKVSDDDIEKLEALIPQVPNIVSQGVTVVNSAITNFDQRLRTLETLAQSNQQMLQQILERLSNAGRTTSRSDGESVNGIEHIG